ncbi:hypothetical protein HK100_009377 [Physocladia obscura]|uniref:DDHD domain-containing protein n=1 Tax=Physocladia obscura TaxID=109957 RepID=A0AAD5XME8_9FUNG|nr:hypothetical protein HK100_009377 [Physocladia obscura]
MRRSLITSLGPRAGGISPVSPTKTKATNAPCAQKKTNTPRAAIFVVHGMGSQVENYGRFDQNLAQLRKTCADVLNEDFGESDSDLDTISDSINGPSVAFIGVEWHSLVHGLDSVDARMNLVTLPTTPIFRLICNDAISDVLYYYSAFHGQKVLKIVAKVLNTEYRKFMAQHPDFGGKICFLGHSLGGVICYDLLANQDIAVEMENDDNNGIESDDSESNKQNPDAQKNGPASKHEEKKKRCRTHFEISYPKLDFTPDILVTIGTQIGAVMIMRGQSPQEYPLPSTMIHRNIFHLYDPVAYRLEPLVDPRYADISPQPIQRPSCSFSANASFTSLAYYRSLSQLISRYIPDIAAVSTFADMIPPFPQIPQLSTVTAAASATTDTSDTESAERNNTATPGFGLDAFFVVGGIGIQQSFSEARKAVFERMVGLTRSLFDAGGAFGIGLGIGGSGEASSPTMIGVKRNHTRDLREIDGIVDIDEYNEECKRIKSLRKIVEPTGKYARKKNPEENSNIDVSIDESEGIVCSEEQIARIAMTAGLAVVGPSLVDGVLETIKSAVRRVSNAFISFDSDMSNNETSNVVSRDVANDKKWQESTTMELESKISVGAQSTLASPSLTKKKFVVPEHLPPIVTAKKPATNTNAAPIAAPPPPRRAHSKQEVEEALTTGLAAAAARVLQQPPTATNSDSAVSAIPLENEQTQNIKASESNNMKDSKDIHKEKRGEKPLPLKERLDYFVTESLIDSTVHQYIVGMRAHFSYWTNKEAMYLIIDDLLREKKE